MSRARRRFIVAMVCLLWTTGAQAQTSLQIPLQFDFINPGAKSLALGGAFAGLADDATASFANPAGLTQLATPEASVELRGTRTTSRFLQRGRLSGDMINEGTDTIQGPVFGESVGSHTGVGYFSLVYPHRSHKWVVAAYRHELARVHQTFFSNGVFQKDPAEFTSRRDSPQDGLRSVDVTGYGAAGVYKLTRNIAVGGGLAAYSFSLDSVFRRFDIVGFLGPPNLNVEFGRSTQQGSGVGLAPTIGATVDHGAARVGIVYRRGASFDYTTQDGGDPLRSGVFRVPDTLALGASLRVRRFIVSGEITRVTYSRLVDDFVVDQARASGREANFGIDDGTEGHASVQYGWRRQRGAPIRIRVGTWYDPDHAVHFTPVATATTVSDRLFNERLTAALSQGRSQVHATGGVGLTVTPRLEFNAGFDVASRSRVLSTSFIVHLGQEVVP